MNEHGLPPPYNSNVPDQQHMPYNNSNVPDQQHNVHYNQNQPPMGWNQAPVHTISSPPPVVIHPQHSSTTVEVSSNQFPGGCPVCHSQNSFKTGYTGCGYTLGICFFPVGILCCMLCCEKKYCRNCNFTTS